MGKNGTKPVVEEEVDPRDSLINGHAVSFTIVATKGDDDTTWEIEGVARLGISKDKGESWVEGFFPVKTFDNDINAGMATLMLSFSNSISSDDFFNPLKDKLFSEEEKGNDADGEPAGDSESS